VERIVRGENLTASTIGVQPMWRATGRPLVYGGIESTNPLHPSKGRKRCLLTGAEGSNPSPSSGESPPSARWHANSLHCDRTIYGSFRYIVTRRAIATGPFLKSEPRKSGSHATRRWRGESAANSSRKMPNSPASWEYTGNFIDSDLGGASRAAKNDIKSVPYGPIP